LNHRKKTKADGSRLIPRKHTETLVLLSVQKASKSDYTIWSINWPVMAIFRWFFLIWQFFQLLWAYRDWKLCFYGCL